MDLLQVGLSQGINGGVYHDKQLNVHTAELILVSAHVAASKEFFNYLTCDGMRGQLARVFIDKAHQIVITVQALDRESWSCVALDGELCSNCKKAAEIPFQLSIADFPQLDKPLVPSNPLNPLSELVSITVDTHTALCEQISAGECQLMLLKHILDSAQANTCLDCWFTESIEDILESK
ncbi:hypothetical protein DFJ43DRAFT_1044686 [Lentinula guzmanii]|uniref:Uncharacterized protein n=1 Tax=Lentinula guzmanii TaxID=2804957 RepID=A0AA38MTT1_9AGAR|nr:hypothetical protein DFJ43DRAFT_1044686 [Lentinula guzmanii]